MTKFLSFKHRITVWVAVLAYICPVTAQPAEWDDNMQRALDALKATDRKGDSYERSKALCDIAAIDLAAALDSAAEKYACDAERIARSKGYPDILARALTVKANVCAFAELDSTFNRNDEGLRYALEAVESANTAANDSLLMEAFCAASQLYVNKNRWNKQLDRYLYAQAGSCLDKADSLSGKIHFADKAKLLAYHMRYFRQGGQTEKAIEHCERIFSLCEDDYYLLKAQICDQLTALYIGAGRLQDAADAHSAYVHYQTHYTHQREADKLQELQEKYETDLKDALIEKKTFQLLFLIVACLLAAALATILLYRFLDERKKRQESERENLAKEELIEFISKDLRNPLNSTVGELEKFFARAAEMSEDKIISESQKLIEEERHLNRNVAKYVSDIVISRKKAFSESGLSKREMEILRLSEDGLSVPQIASKLFLSPRTVSNHKASIYSKLGVRTNAEMCKVAREKGII